MALRSRIVILGVFNADTTYRADRLPRLGETLLGRSFALGPGGKGSNQAVAAARAGGEVHFVTRLGEDAFADMALALWAEAGVVPEVTRDPSSHTGAACIFVEDATGENAIVISPGVALNLSAADLDARADLVGGAAVFVTQLEQPLVAARRGLEIAREGGARTVLNPAPGATIDPDMLALCDFVTPNQTEVEQMAGIPVADAGDARRAAGALLEAGAGAVVVTMGEAGALYRDRDRWEHVPAFDAGPVVETTGAGDTFNGAFAAALARGDDPIAAVRFGCAAAALSVTRAGAAASAPTLEEIEALLSGAG